MKQITLNHIDTPDAKPFTCPVDMETDTHVWVKPKWAIGNATMMLTKRADGSFVNEHGVVYVRVKRDTRRKPYSVQYRSGIGEGNSTHKFATLAEVQKYVRGRWLGVEYMDGEAVFHNDFGHFYLKGCVLADLGTRPDVWEWEWKTL